ncbi:MAG: hypothetical protein KGJ04_04175 [Gammaproteobacteria bacterium]|nr:hypothetical protein [Gammaproteobacteria bacterium]
MQPANLKIATAFVLGAVLAGGIPFAFAQSADAPAGVPRSVTVQREVTRGFPAGMHRNWRRSGPVGAAIADLNGMRRLYLLEGRRQNLAELYRYVLSKTQNPVLRNYAYRHLARAELQVTNTDQAIATLRQSLDENLVRLNQAPATKP